MAVCRFADGAGLYDVTPIENMFMLEYMPTAPDGFLRVYLYMRMLALHPELGEGVEDVANALKMDVDGVLNAMSYWERQGLACRLSDNPPTFALMSVHSAAQSDPMDREYYQYRDYNALLQAMFAEDKIIPPKYIAMAHDWLTILNFTQDGALKLVESLVKKSRAKSPDPAKIFARADKLAAQWSERGVRTLEDVERALIYEGTVEETVRAVQKQLSIRREATPEEIRMVERWLNEWHYTKEQIIEKCAETTKARNPSFGYLNGILENNLDDRNRYFRELQGILRALNPYEAAPSESQIESYKKMLEAGFEPETVMLAAEQCRNRNQTRFDDLRKLLGSWKAENLLRRDVVEAKLQKHALLEAEVQALMKLAGIGRNPNAADIMMYEKWIAAYPESLIFCAAEFAVGMDKPMLYIDNRLSRWAADGVKTADEARAKQADRAKSGSAPTVNPALNYEQREHHESDYDGLFVDLTGEYAQGGDQA